MRFNPRAQRGATARRRKHLKNIDATGMRIRGIYMEAARDLARRAAGAKEGSLTERWLTDYQRTVQKRMEQMRGDLGAAIRGGMRASARLPGEAVEGWLSDALALCGVDGSFSGVLSQVPDDALRALLDGRMYRDGKSLSRRIWSKTDILQRNIEDVCAQALAQKKSALALARDLEAYVNPEAKMPVSWLKTYPDIPFDRQIDYNAMRLARTMINHSYWAANLETAKRNPFCQAMHWALSPSHFERQVAHFGEDECDAYASHDEGLGRGNFPIEELPMPHAQCLCVQYQVVPELDAVADRLGAWVDGGSDPELDKAFGAWKEQRLGLKPQGNRDIIDLPDEEIFRSLSAKATNYDVWDEETQQYYHFKEGTHIQNRQVFAGYGTRTPLHDFVAEGLTQENEGSDPTKWQHVKGNGILETADGDRPAEIHWFANETSAEKQCHHKVKRWLDEG